MNNLGDPFIESNYGVHSRQFEVGVLDWLPVYGKQRRVNIGDTLQIVAQREISMVYYIVGLVEMSFNVMTSSFCS